MEIVARGKTGVELGDIPGDKVTFTGTTQVVNQHHCMKNRSLVSAMMGTCYQMRPNLILPELPSGEPIEKIDLAAVAHKLP